MGVFVYLQPYAKAQLTQIWLGAVLENIPSSSVAATLFQMISITNILDILPQSFTWMVVLGDFFTIWTLPCNIDKRIRTQNRNHSLHIVASCSSSCFTKGKIHHFSDVLIIWMLSCNVLAENKYHPRRMARHDFGRTVVPTDPNFNSQNVIALFWIHRCYNIQQTSMKSIVVDLSSFWFGNRSVLKHANRGGRWRMRRRCCCWWSRTEDPIQKSHSTVVVSI